MSKDCKGGESIIEDSRHVALSLSVTTTSTVDLDPAYYSCPIAARRMADAFLGIDIDDVDEQPKLATMGERKTMHGRKERSGNGQQQQATSSSETTTKKPAPPPRPPASLVSLVRRDGSVRAYFASLMENLDYDVGKWKDEAARWKARRDDAMTAAVAAGTNADDDGNGASAAKNGKKAARRRRRSPSERAKEAKNDIDRIELIAQKKTRTKRKMMHDNDDTEVLDEGEEIPITDELLFGDMSSDDDDDDDENIADDDKDNGVLNHNTSDIIQTMNKNDEMKQYRNHVLEQLKLAEQYLHDLGISLVEVEVKSTHTTTPRNVDECIDEMSDDCNRDTTTNTNVDNTPTAAATTTTTSTSTTTERILHRQSDEKVVAEMMASIRTLIKTSSYIGGGMNSINLNSNDDDDYDDDDIRDDGKDVQSQFDHHQQLSSVNERHHIRTLCRKYHPFCKDGQRHTPTIYFSNSSTHNIIDDNVNDNDIADETEIVEQHHPASLGLRKLMTILYIMDAHCGDDIEDAIWNTIFQNNDDDDNDDDNNNDDSDNEHLIMLRVGMRNRCRLTERIASSLHVEITRVWALIDRAANAATATVHFHPADVIDDIDNPDVNNKSYEEDGIIPYGTKSYNRLVTMEERICHALIATLLYRRRGDWQKAVELVIGYIVSTAPSICVEQYPKLPPVLSFCVLEALISPDNYIPKNVMNDKDMTRAVVAVQHNKSWFRGCMNELFSSSDVTLLRALAKPINIAIEIWKERSFCTDDRIRDIATIELAAYERIRKLDDGDWLSTSPIQPIIEISDWTNFVDNGNDTSDKVRAVAMIACTVSLLSSSNADEASTFVKGMDNLTEECENKDQCNNLLLPGGCAAYYSIMYRRWESMKLGNISGRHTAAAFTIEDEVSPILDARVQNIDVDDWQAISILIHCCVISGDGQTLQLLAKRTLPHTIQTTMVHTASRTVGVRNLISKTISSLIDAGEVPTVRVINLKRRPDRALDFMSCAVHKEQLIVIKGPSRMRSKSLNSKTNRNKTKAIDYSLNVERDDKHNFGNYAFDGQCSREELEDQLRQRLENGNSGTLTDFVADKWRPSELKAFDRVARGDFELVHTSMTEKACTLSHIASWMGVESSLSSEIDTVGRINYGGHEWYQNKLLRMFSISGFARGSALLHENEDMDPVPVCVILEDDAILVDRFAERLASLLEELPRDFHFCSLGYSRPKAAPIIEYSSQLGIPSCLWYLTGYILSYEGARHLIESLPVAGPVDSWIGLKMCANWDNTYGDMIGVGKYTTAKTSLPPRKDLAKIMKFHAFAALVPLCAQKGGWRDKDTDITYSG